MPTVEEVELFRKAVEIGCHHMEQFASIQGDYPQTAATPPPNDHNNSAWLAANMLRGILAGNPDIVGTIKDYVLACKPAQPPTPQPIEQIPRIPNEKLAGEHYGIDDYIKLVVRPGNNVDVTCIRYLQKWGAWWKVRAAVNRGEKWLLKSISGQPREISKTMVEEMTILKDLDPRYAVIAVLKFPMSWSHKVAELTARTQQE